MMKVPFVDLYAQYQSIKDEIDHAIQTILDSSSFIGGSHVESFEKRFGNYIGVDYCIGCANGTDALEIALEAVGIGEGDEVIVPAHTWMSTASAVSRVRATPIFVDVHPDFYTIDTRMVESKISTRTKAIIPVHFYGLPADMPTLVKIAAGNKLIIIEDCAQAHGASINDRKVGTFGDVATFSFYPGKNLGGYGDGGCIVSNNNEIAEQCRLISHLGQKGKHNHMIIGRNSRLDALQAAILSVKLDHLDEWIEARRNIATMYSDQLHGSELKLPVSPENFKHVFHLFVIQVSQRNELQKALKEKGIQTQIHYPAPVTSSRPYSDRGQFPLTDNMTERILSLPMYAELDAEKIARVTKVINSFLNKQ